MKELSKTLENYKNTYAKRLAKYLNDYEDNTESFFLQKESDACYEILNILNTYKTNSKSIRFQTVKEKFDISMLEKIGFDLTKTDNHITSIKSILEFIDDKKRNIITLNNDDSYKETTWFKIGLLFAKGDVLKLYNKYKSDTGHFKKITLELGFKETDRPYFSETINNSKKGNKNIYSDLTKMEKIFKHCQYNHITICDEFTKKLNELRPK